MYNSAMLAVLVVGTLLSMGGAIHARMTGYPQHAWKFLLWMMGFLVIGAIFRPWE